MNRTNLINYIIKKHGYKSYLEIGLGTVKNFAFVNCEIKMGVDPDKNSKDIHKKMNVAGEVFCMTSDAFFTHYSYDFDSGVNKQGDVFASIMKKRFNIIFIDGLHYADQVRKDIINAWECLTDGGCLVIHDTNPDREEITHVPRDSKEWCGDVYKAIHQIDGPPKFTLKDDHGVTVIRKTGPLVMSDGVIEWEGFDLMREAILHLVTWEEAIKIIDEWK